MLFFEHVSTRTQVSAEEYLHMTFEHDAEFVRGELVERGLPNYLHSRLQFLILLRLIDIARDRPVFPCPELRLRLAPDIYRIPDISIFAGNEPTESAPSTPPLVVIEILSPDDRHSVLMEKLGEYRRWGVSHIWVVDGINRRLSVYSDAGLQHAASVVLPEYSFEIAADDLFSSIAKV
jgi:Uma2 family endonuclease